MPLVAPAHPSLADAVDDALAAALAGHPEVCLWCGEAVVVTTAADIWSGRAAVRCPHCGSELSGIVPRGLREPALRERTGQQSSPEANG